MNTSEFAKLLPELSVPFAIVAAVATGVIERFGDATTIQPTDLIDQLFGDQHALVMLHDSFEGRLKPQSMGQGDVAAILCTPMPNLIGATFCKTTLDPAEYYRWTMRLNDRIERAWQ